MYLKRAGEFVSEVILGEKKLPAGHSYPRPGTTTISVIPWSDDVPFGAGSERLVWLAFCSGDHLRQDHRKIPLLLGHWRHAAGFSDDTIVFEDEFGLPKRVLLFAANGNLASQYEVLATTNILGRVIPIEFRLIQHSALAKGALDGTVVTVEGKVRAIKPVGEPSVPEEVSKELAR